MDYTAIRTGAQRLVQLFFGAGSAGVGVAKQLMAFFKSLGLSEAQARERIWVSHRLCFLIACTLMFSGR
jgi:hypothetical protein